MEMARPKVILKNRREIAPPIMSVAELERLGGGKVAYIREMDSDEAHELFPGADLPMGVAIFSLHAADGTPIALTDSRQAAVGHAIGADLKLAYVH